ncbi:unnamed protein product [Kluyveromyces dobzhanskii CBS 2104]|uniref:histone deacetylase n=1 Tax=Kluyveromyces dobzhanskii CBS 2104 TaxID=1427455 RepID=A0A0A8L2M7_9SACH|nr:unnamed protein product [Kluyveromyces dobzhanskii CBS 2104]
MRFIISTSSLQSQVADLLPCNNGRKAQLIFALIRAYGLLEYFDHVETASIATLKDMVKFHSPEYVKLLLIERTADNADDHFKEHDQVLRLAEVAMRFYQEFNDNEDSQIQWFNDEYEMFHYFVEEFDTRPYGQNNDSLELKDQDLIKTGLQHDCPKFPFLSMYLQLIVGGTLSLLGKVDRATPSIAINWEGGRHHALKQYASGFCYVNDIVLLIQSLRRKGWRKVTYVDFDLHYGDGVAKAFQFSENVQSISVHLYEPGFFPGTGSLEETKNSKQMVNIPVLHGMDDNYLTEIMSSVINPLIEKFNADCVVIQCGADGLSGDKYNEWQLSIRGLTQQILSVMNMFKTKQIFLLGGGGGKGKVASEMTTKTATYKN